MGTIIKDTWKIMGWWGGNGRDLGRVRGWAGVGGKGRELYLNNNKIKKQTNKKTPKTFIVFDPIFPLLGIGLEK